MLVTSVAVISITLFGINGLSIYVSVHFRISLRVFTPFDS
jgi:hypothetical protein